jgi:hypothetical protein
MGSMVSNGGHRERPEERRGVVASTCPRSLRDEAPANGAAGREVLPHGRGDCRFASEGRPPGERKRSSGGLLHPERSHVSDVSTLRTDVQLQDLGGIQSPPDHDLLAANIVNNMGLLRDDPRVVQIPTMAPDSPFPTMGVTMSTRSSNEQSFAVFRTSVQIRVQIRSSGSEQQQNRPWERMSPCLLPSSAGNENGAWDRSSSGQDCITFSMPS